jgi:hypothetical protein
VRLCRPNMNRIEYKSDHGSIFWDDEPWSELAVVGSSTKASRPSPPTWRSASAFVASHLFVSKTQSGEPGKPTKRLSMGMISNSVQKVRGESQLGWWWW